MPLDLSKIDLDALTVKQGIITTEWAAFQNAHGLAKVLMGVGIIGTLGSMVAAGFPGYPQIVSVAGVVASIASAVAGSLISKNAAGDYQDSRSETKTGVANAVAAVVQAHADVATAAQAPTQVTIQEAAPVPIPTTTVQAPVVPPGPAPGSIVPPVLQALLLCTVLFLTGCLGTQARDDGTKNAESILSSAEALRITLGINPGIEGLDLTQPLSPIQKAQVYIYNIEQQAVALGGLLTTTTPGPAVPITPVSKP